MLSQLVPGVFPDLIEQFKFKSEKIIGIQKPTGKVRKIRNIVTIVVTKYKDTWLHAISSYKDHCNFSNTSGPYFWANFEY